MNQYTLQFESKQIEKEFDEAQLNTLQKNISLTSFYYFFTAVQAMILRLIEQDDPYYFMLGLHLGVTVIVVGLLNFLAWRYPKWITPLCQLFSLAHTFVNVRMIKRQERITPYLAIYSFLFMLIHMRFTQFFLPALIVILIEHIFMISFLFGYGFGYDRFCTYMILSLIVFLITEFQREKQRRMDFIQRQLDLKSAKTWKFVMLEIQPQITALLSVNNQGNKLNWKLKEINKIAQDEFNLDDEEKFQDFLQNVKIDNKDDDFEETRNSGNTLDKTLTMEIDQYVQKQFKATTLLKRADTYFKQDPSNTPQPLVVFGHYQHYKFKIIIAKIFYLNESALLIKMENLSWEDEIKKLKELDQYKDRLLANVSHDLRTPLIGINFNFDQIQADQSKEEIEKFKIQGKANSDLLMSYINDILDYCQMKEQKIKLNLSLFNLPKLLQEAVDLLNIPARLKGINITLKSLIQQENECNIYSDERRIKQIIINLLSNSLKFTKKGGKVELIVRTHQDRYKIEIVDNGAGIKKEVIPQLAKPYATFGNSL